MLVVLARRSGGALCDLMVFAALAVVGATVCAADPGSQGRIGDVVSKQQRFYQDTFPGLHFVVLEGGEALGNEVADLARLLGREPMSLDYEHPPKLRALLMEATFERLMLMLRNQMPSATLFRPDPTVRADRDVCVVTLPPCAVLTDGDTETYFRLELTDDELTGIPKDLQVECEAYLGFAFDHEAYHCLSSFYEGGQPMSFEELWGQYWHFRQEQGADAYAMSRHLQRHGRRTDFADDLRRIRGVALFDGDIDHRTGSALDQVLTLPLERLSEVTANDMFELAGQIRDGIVPDYQAYLAYRRAAIEAMVKLGVSAAVVAAASESLPEGGFDPELVRELTDEGSRFRAELVERREASEPHLEIRGD